MTPRCPECGSEKINLFAQKGEAMCPSCGLVVEDSLFDSNPFVDEAKQRHANLPGFQTAGGMKVDGAIVKNSWLLSTKEKNLMKAKDQLKGIVSKLRLPEYIEKDSYYIFKTAVDQELNIGRDNLSMLYGSVYASC